MIAQSKLSRQHTDGEFVLWKALMGAVEMRDLLDELSPEKGYGDAVDHSRLHTLRHTTLLLPKPHPSPLNPLSSPFFLLFFLSSGSPDSLQRTTEHRRVLPENLSETAARPRLAV